MQGDDGEVQQNWYDKLMDFMSNELEKLIELCVTKVLLPPPKSHGGQRYSQQEQDNAWK